MGVMGYHVHWKNLLLLKGIKSRSSLEAMGFVVTDIDIRFMEEEAASHIRAFEKVVEKHSKIVKKYYIANRYVPLNGENLFMEVYQYPESFGGILKGRAPLYDNEIIITEMVADTLALKMGDTVTISGTEKEAEYLISGIYQTSSDSGMAFGMSLAGAGRIGVKHIEFMGISLEDASEGDKIAEELNDRYGTLIQAEKIDFEDESFRVVFNLAALAMQVMIYVFSAVFALITVIMVCTKAFAVERTDIGIYKALGFTVGKLRLQFAIRFFLVSFLGGLFGAVIASFYSVQVLNVIFRLFGVSRVAADNTLFTFAGAVAFVSLCVLFFAYLVSGRVRRVETRELITE